MRDMLNFKKETLPQRPYSALEVSRHMVNHINKRGGSINNLKLQKLLFVVQTDFFLKEDAGCFTDYMLACDFGVIIPKVYEEFKCHSGCTIPKVRTYYEEYPTLTQKRFKDDIISEEDKKKIDDLTDKFYYVSNIGFLELIQKSSLWKECYLRAKTPFDTIITKERVIKFWNKD